MVVSQVFIIIISELVSDFTKFISKAGSLEDSTSCWICWRDNGWWQKRSQGLSLCLGSHSTESCHSVLGHWWESKRMMRWLEWLVSWPFNNSKLSFRFFFFNFFIWERAPFGWLTPQVHRMAAAGLETWSRSPTWVVGTQLSGPSPLRPRNWHVGIEPKNWCITWASWLLS